MIRIMFIGDIVGFAGCKIVHDKLRNIKEDRNINFVIANGENSAVGNGTTEKSAEYLFHSGVDALTGGNHTFKKREFIDYMVKSSKIIRPANYPKGTPGRGFSIFKCLMCEICVINISGVVFLEPLRCPFETLDEILEQTVQYKIKILDFHAEATAEKRALAFYADGRVSAILGTHTHVQTSDEEIFPRGTSYITDVGMSGLINSVLGVTPSCSIKRVKGKIPLKFEYDDSGPSKIECVIIDVDENTGKSLNIERQRFNFN